ncbi:remorin-like [Vigna radiata var. radiata]|uniref:Remorin-like n=1 Tax=Vigna radiata var. radiata TaxID=3916 RepID=A0A1S3U803_VIGRR|nr:remorin-like [Vigna radiata var. radiata]
MHGRSKHIDVRFYFLRNLTKTGSVKMIESTTTIVFLLAIVATEKRLSLIKAWEESEKSKAENKAHKNLSAISAWENSKKASVEADLKKKEEELEKKKAEYAEKIKNKIAEIHKEAEEKRAIIEAKKGEELLKETAAKYRATGTAPKKLLGCF